MGVDWAELADEKSEFATTLARIIATAVSAGAVRSDLTLSEVRDMTPVRDDHGVCKRLARDREHPT